MTDRWLAKLDLGFAERDGYCWLRKRDHKGPLTLQRPFYPEGPDTPHVYVLHPPGGMVSGDELKIRCVLDPQARALVTTPGAAKFYRARTRAADTPAEERPFAEQVQDLEVGPGASLEWMPQETIVFSGANATTRTQVSLAATATFAAWDIACLGRPGSREPFEAGRFRQSLEIWREGRLLFRERNLLCAGADVLSSLWGLQRKPVSGTFVYASATFSGADDDSRSGGVQSELMNRLRDATRGTDSEQTSVSLLRGVLVCRYLGSSTERAKRCFAAAWQVLRPQIVGRPACSPRIWAT